MNSQTNFKGANIIKANLVNTIGTPKVKGSLCSEDTAFTNPRVAFVIVLEISFQESGILVFPVIVLNILPGWNVSGQCCFPVKDGIKIGC